MTTLYTNISACHDAVEKLLDNATGDLAKELRKIRSALSEELQKWIDKTIPGDTDRYRAATKALREAETELKEALADEARLATSIGRIAKATDLVAKVLV